MPDHKRLQSYGFRLPCSGITKKVQPGVTARLPIWQHVFQDAIAHVNTTDVQGRAHL